MLYLDYSRGEGEWVANQYGGGRTWKPSRSCAGHDLVARAPSGVLTIAEE
jgi:1,4-alpha-glucan branching enzyme